MQIMENLSQQALDRKQEKMLEMQEKLKELFQFEDQELDFGIYRIMNIKRKEIQQFIEEGLVETIRDEIKTAISDTNPLEELKELEDKIKQTLGCSPAEAKKEYHDLPVVQQYVEKEALLKTAKKERHIEEQIYDDILNFFSRYYDKGDFISKMRYSQDGKYAIPYNGEEVYLHWANSDQYYIKTTETFKHYRFKTRNIKINFEIKAEETETEQNNTRGEERYFLYLNSKYDHEEKVLNVYFGYRPLTTEEQEKTLSVYNDYYRTSSNRLSTFSKGQGKTIMNGYNAQKIFEKHSGPEFSSLKNPHVLKNDQLSDKSELEWHLHKYTTNNTSDYFIHKNLKAFLSRELDFYIKNEILHVDNILDEKDMHLEINRVKALKKIALKIIAFLGEIENFQKQLWLKKKFVIETNWCFTLDKIENNLNLSEEKKEEFYEQIRNNKDQVDEWIDLYAVDKIEGNLLDAGFSNPPSIKFLKENPYLMVDTKHFKENGRNEFKDHVISIFDNIDDETDGWLIHSENFGALNNLQTLGETYKKVKCIYIDPPYNTGNDGFIYKDSYKDSSWLSMMCDRLLLARNILSDDGVIFISIDDTEVHHLREICDLVFGKRNFIANVIWEKKFSPQNDAKWFSDNHDHILVYCKNRDFWKPRLLERSERANSRYKNPDNDPRGVWTSGDVSVKTYSKEYDYPIKTPNGRIVNPQVEDVGVLRKGK